MYLAHVQQIALDVETTLQLEYGYKMYTFEHRRRATR